MSGSLKTILVVGGIGIIALLLFEKSSVITVGSTTVPVNSTAGTVATVASASGSLATAFKNLFSGSTTQPLTSGAAPANPNNIDPVTGGQNIDPITGLSDDFDV